jgi:hypothetical protein
MVQELSQALDLIEKINNSLGINLLSSEELKDAKNNIAWIERSQQNLTTTIKQANISDLNNEKMTNKIMVDFNREIGDIAQCMEDIHAQIILSAQRYVEFLDKS